jgi:hypothetical protein
VVIGATVLSPHAGRLWFQIALFMLVASGILALVQERDSAEFVISVMTCVMSAAFLTILLILVRRSNR